MMNIIKSLGVKKVISIVIVLVFAIGAIVYFSTISNKGTDNATASTTVSTTTGKSVQPAPKTNVNIQKSSASIVYVNIYKDSFSPKSLTIKVGTTVTWVNKDNNFQAVIADMFGPTSPDLVKNGTYSYKFSTPGIYGYHNKNSATTTGMIIVEKSL